MSKIALCDPTFDESQTPSLTLDNYSSSSVSGSKGTERKKASVGFIVMWVLLAILICVLVIIIIVYIVKKCCKKEKKPVDEV